MNRYALPYCFLDHRVPKDRGFNKILIQIQKFVASLSLVLFYYHLLQKN